MPLPSHPHPSPPPPPPPPPQGILDHFNEDKIAKVKELEQGISEEGKVEEALSYYLTESIDVRHENNAMQLEEEYRRRQHHVNREVKRRLDYQVYICKIYISHL